MVREISEHTLFREQFRVAGLVHHGQSSDGEKNTGMESESCTIPARRMGESLYLGSTGY